MFNEKLKEESFSTLVVPEDDNKQSSRHCIAFINIGEKKTKEGEWSISQSSVLISYVAVTSIYRIVCLIIS